jgi:upstream activation factor subunit UAF30
MYEFTDAEIAALKALARVELRKTRKEAKKTRMSLLFRPMKVSWVLRQAIGLKVDKVPRTQVIKTLWAYIQKNGLQDKKNRRNINCDEGLQIAFGKKQVSMFEMTKLVSKHLS